MKKVMAIAAVTVLCGCVESKSFGDDPIDLVVVGGIIVPIVGSRRRMVELKKRGLTFEPAPLREALKRQGKGGK